MNVGFIFDFIFGVSDNPSVGLTQWGGCSLPAMTGPYGVGTVVLPMVDSGRSGAYADGSTSEYREFMTQIWYPANRGVGGPKNIYLDGSTAKYILKGTSIPELDEIFRFLIKTHAVVGAKMVTDCERFPVLIFSPGWRTSYFIYQSVLEELASHGYIVIGVNSPNSALITSFPDGHFRVTPDIQDEGVKEKYNQEVVDDLKFVVNQLMALDSNQQLPLIGRIDFRRVGCFGHSFGGAAAVRAGSQSLRVAAIANFDGSLRGQDYKKVISKPMLMVWSELHSQEDMTTEAIWENIFPGSYQMGVKGTDHMSFSDYMLIGQSMLGHSLSGNPDPIDPARAIQITRDCIRTFFDAKLKHANPNEMDKIASGYGEVRLKKS